MDFELEKQEEEDGETVAETAEFDDDDDDDGDGHFALVVAGKLNEQQAIAPSFTFEYYSL